MTSCISLPQSSNGTDDPNTWQSWTYVTWFLLLEGNMKEWWLHSWLPTISLELKGRVGTAVATFTHAMLTIVCTELEYRNMLWAIRGTLSELPKPARRRSQNPDDITYQNTFSFHSLCLLLLKQYYKGCLESNASIFVSLLPKKVSKWNTRPNTTQDVYCCYSSFFQSPSCLIQFQAVLKTIFP
jgi:hypothetical protein